MDGSRLPSIDRSSPADLAVVAGAVLIVATLVGSAALAPAVDAGSQDGETRTLVGVQGGGTGWHHYGRVHMLEGSTVAWTEDGAGSYFDVTMLEDGRVLAAFGDDGYEDCGEYRSPCARTGFRIIDPDPEPRVVEEYSFPVGSMSNSEVHDAEPLPGGGFVMTDMHRERIVVVEDGEEVWEWRAGEFYESPGDPTSRDWLHINDVDRIGDGRFLVSVRNANQLLVVERGAGVVEVVNADDDGTDESCLRDGQLVDADGDGDVRCGDPAVLNHQHNPQWLGDGAVLVADSDNDRVVELHRNDAGEWEVAWVLERAGGIGLRWPRDADRLANGHTVVTDTLNQRILEVDAEGELVWSTRTERIPYEADRVPENEPVGGPRHVGDDGELRRPTGGDVPVLSAAVVGLRSVAPWLPIWFRELQLGAIALGVLLVGGGLYRRRSR